MVLRNLSFGSHHTWEVDCSMNWCTGGHRGMDQVRVLEPEPCRKRTWVRAAERHPLPLGEPQGIRHDSSEVSQVSQCLAAAEEAQVVCAQVPKWRGEETFIPSVRIITPTQLISSKYYRMQHDLTSM